MCIMGDAREGKRFVMALSWLSLLFVSVKIYFQNIIPGIEKKRRYFAAIGLVTFCDIVCSLSL